MPQLLSKTRPTSARMSQPKHGRHARNAVGTRFANLTRRRAKASTQFRILWVNPWGRPLRIVCSRFRHLADDAVSKPFHGWPAACFGRVADAQESHASSRTITLPLVDPVQRYVVTLGFHATTRMRPGCRH